MIYISKYVTFIDYFHCLYLIIFLWGAIFDRLAL